MTNYTARGPGRWERARKNAEARPNSAGAKLYRQRVSNAADTLLTVEDYMRDVFGRTGPFDFMKKEYERGQGYVTGEKVAYRTCGVGCLGMQLQLDYGVKTREGGLTSLVYDILAESDETVGVRLTPYDTMTQAVRCQVCGSVVLSPVRPEPTNQPEWNFDAVDKLKTALSGDKTKEEPIKKTRTVEQKAYVYSETEGTFVPLEQFDLRVVWMDEKTHDILENNLESYEMGQVANDIGETMTAREVALYLG